MRLFIAIELSAEIKRELAAVSRALRERATGGRFVPTDNMHITLRFIGETDDAEGLSAAMREACRGARPFTVSLGSCGFFERTASGNHRVYLVTVGGELDKLFQLRSALETALEERGVKRDPKPFVPHITLGRNVGLDELAALELERIGLKGSAAVSGVTLFESTKRNG